MDLLTNQPLFNFSFWNLQINRSNAKLINMCQSLYMWYIFFLGNIKNKQLKIKVNHKQNIYCNCFIFLLNDW